MATSPRRILLIEDSPSDVAILQGNLRILGVNCELTPFRTGPEALQYLEGRLALGSRGSLPEVIILDLRLPGESGLEILRKLKSHATLRSIPVIIMTVSEDTRDLVQSYQLGGTFFMSKSGDREILKDIFRNLGLL